VPSLIPKQEKEHVLSYFMVITTFLICLGWLLLWLFGTAFEIEVPDWSAAECSIFLGPLLALLYGEKIKEKNMKATRTRNEKDETYT
jgi:hypothetical protein